MSSEWTTQTEWMRQVGATAASWSESGRLLTVTLGPVPTPKTQPERPQDEPKQAAVVRTRVGSAPGLTRPARSVGQ